MLRRLGGRHDTRARFALFEGDKGKLLPPQFLSLYIVIAWKNSRRRSCVSLRILVVQKKPRAQLSATFPSDNPLADSPKVLKNQPSLMS